MYLTANSLRKVFLKKKGKEAQHLKRKEKEAEPKIKLIALFVCIITSKSRVLNINIELNNQLCIIHPLL